MASTGHTQLGEWDSWADNYHTMQFQRGAHCWKEPRAFSRVYGEEERHPEEGRRSSQGAGEGRGGEGGRRVQGGVLERGAPVLPLDRQGWRRVPIESRDRRGRQE